MPGLDGRPERHLRPRSLLQGSQGGAGAGAEGARCQAAGSALIKRSCAAGNFRRGYRINRSGRKAALFCRGCVLTSHGHAGGGAFGSECSGGFAPFRRGVMLERPDSGQKAVVAERIVPLDRSRTFITLLVVLYHSVINYTYYGIGGDRMRWIGFDGVALFCDSFFMACMFF